MAVWIALAVFALGVVAGLAYAIVRGLAMWRQVKRTNRAIGSETARIARVADEISAHLERANGSSQVLAERAARLRASAAALQLQVAAVREARGALRRTFWFLPDL